MTHRIALVIRQSFLPLSLSLLLALNACSGSQSPPPSSTPTPNTTETTEATGGVAAPLDGETGEASLAAESEDSNAASREPTCEGIGFEKVPALPSPLARELNRKALKAHGRGEYEASLADFRKALAVSPEYDVVRFNIACALSKLGRTEEAIRELETLLSQNFPTYAPRLASDDDLAPLRDDEQLRAHLERVSKCYDDALGSGMPLVAYRNEKGRSWAQAVIYRGASGRIIPMGPRISKHVPVTRYQGEWPMIAPFLDVKSRRTIVVTYVGNDAEDPHLDNVKVSVFKAPSGELAFEKRWPSSIEEAPPFLRAGLIAEGALVESEDFRLKRVAWIIDARGKSPTKRSMPEQYIIAGSTAWWIRSVAPPSGYRVERNHLITPNGSHKIGRGHATQNSRRVIVDEEVGFAFVISESAGDCGSPDRHIVDMVKLRDGSVTRWFSGNGQIVVELGQDGALYIQTRDEFLRFPNPLEKTSEVLPTGLGLSSNPWSFNPYC